MSTAGRERIAAAQRKRWAALKATRAATAAARPKRKLSAAGRKAIAEATRRRWAAWRKSKSGARAGRAPLSPSMRTWIEGEAYYRGLPSNLALFPVENPLAAKLYQLAQRGVFIGTSSWKYPGWIGQVYTRESYTVRGRFSKAAFERDSLKEYAESFRTVCADFTFYQFPTETMLAGLFSDVPAGFQMALKVTEEITVKAYPLHDRYGSRAGKRNPNFLNAEVFLKLFLSLILPYRDRVVLIFEFGAFDANEFTAPEEFLEQLGLFLRVLPDGFRYAVEIRNPEFLGIEYLACLHQHKVAHVLNAWSRMPELSDQLLVPNVLTSEFTVLRALLRKGRNYETAVKEFSPYAEVRDPNPGGRAAMRRIVEETLREGRSAFVYVNNRFEGNAPATIAAIVE